MKDLFLENRAVQIIHAVAQRDLCQWQPHAYPVRRDVVDVIERHRRKVGDPRRAPIDEQQRTLVDARGLRPESANADARQGSGVLNNVNARVLLQDIGQVRCHGAFDIDGVDDLDLLRRLGQSRLNASGGHHHALDESTRLENDVQRFRAAGRRDDEILSDWCEQVQLNHHHV